MSTDRSSTTRERLERALGMMSSAPNDDTDPGQESRPQDSDEKTDRKSETIAKLRRLIGDVGGRDAGSNDQDRGTEQDGRSEWWTQKSWAEPGLPAGDTLSVDEGTCYQVVDVRPSFAEHGCVSLQRLGDVRRDELTFVLGEKLQRRCQLSRELFRRAVFIDTETTGLSGGTGTAAFMVGVGSISGDEVRISQLLMRDFDEEPAMLRRAEEMIADAELLVSFNGKSFDAPLLASRMVANRLDTRISDIPHLDMLHLSRRIWKRRWGSCRLTALERNVVRYEREGDVPGSLIPRIYFDYIRGVDRGGIRQVFHHNKLDILSLMALTVRACGLVGDALRRPHQYVGVSSDTGRWDVEGQAIETMSVARLLARRERRDHAIEVLNTALKGLSGGAARRDAQLELAELYRKTEDYDSERAVLEQAIEELKDSSKGEVGKSAFELCRRLAIYYEHTAKELDEARKASNVGLRLLAQGTSSLTDRQTARIREDLQKRVHRLECKMKGEIWY